jgi:hypothetical protein
MESDKPLKIMAKGWHWVAAPGSIDLPFGSTTARNHHLHLGLWVRCHAQVC